jgi:hypothetical protein
MRYIHGCNYPWSTDGSTVFYGLDFGANVWGSHLGVSTRRHAIARDFEQMAALGFVAARWFVFCDGRAGIVYDERGVPVGPDAHLFADVDAALEIAGTYGIAVDFVLFDHRWMFRGVRETIADPVTGDLLEGQLREGRARIMLTRDGRDALIERVVTPLVRRYSPSGARPDLAPHVLAYEFMNEPDFVIDEWEPDLSRHVMRPLPFAILAELVSRVSEVVHRYSSAFTTLGGARLRNLWAWDDDALGLDVLQVHSYPDLRRPQQDEDPFGLAARALGVGRPVLLGEFAGNAREQHPPGVVPPDRDLAMYLEFAYEGGYAGAWPWSFSGTDAYGCLPREALVQFAERHSELVNPRVRDAAPSTD